jgi:hypothetical protein
VRNRAREPTAYRTGACSFTERLQSRREPRRHVGETATVCSVVASAKFASSSRSQPTFLDLDQPYPNAPFTAVIFGSDRAKFGTPETSLRGKRICVTDKSVTIAASQTSSLSIRAS